ncbi:unnamed protein product [Closterium sp. NIES-53]
MGDIRLGDIGFVRVVYITNCVGVAASPLLIPTCFALPYLTGLVTPSSPHFADGDPVEPVEVAVDSGAARGAEPVGAGLGGAVPGVVESEGAEPGGAEPERVEPGSVEPGGAESGGAEPEGAEPERAESGGPQGVPSRQEPLSPQRLREWYARRCSRAAGATGPAAGGASRAGAAGGAAGAGASGAAGPGGAGAKGTGAVGGPSGVGDAGGSGADGPGGTRTGGTGATGASGAAGVGGVGARAVATGGAAGAGAVGAGAVATGGTLGAGAAGGTRARGAAGVVAGDPGAEGTGAVSVVTGGAAQPRPYYVPLLQQVLGLPPSTGPTPPLSASICPPSVGGDCSLGTDVLEDRQEEFECFVAALPHLVSMLLAPEGDPDAPDIPTPRSYAEAIEGTYVDEVPPPGANIVSGMWIFRVKQPPGSPPVFKARYVARGFSQRQGVDFFQTFSPTPKMTTLRVLLHVAAHRDYELHSLDFSTAFLQGSLHEEIWLRRPPGFTGSFREGTQWSLRQPVYGLRQAPREWRDTLRTTLATLGFAPSTADPSLFLCTDTTLPPFYVLVYVDDLVFATADTEALAHVKSELQKRHTCTDLGELTSYLGLRITRDRAYRTITLTQSHMEAEALWLPAQVVLSGHADTSWVDELAMQRLSQGYTFSLGSGSVSWRSTRSSSELRWLTYLLTDLGEAPRSPPVLYVDNKAMLALCQEHSLEHRTKHIALRYFLARDLQQRGQLRLAYVATQANTANIFTKALQPCDHQCFCTMLGLVPTWPYLLTS